MQGGDNDRSNVGYDDTLGEAATPEALAIAAEEYQRLLDLLDDDRLNEIAQCKLEGYRNRGNWSAVGTRLSQHRAEAAAAEIRRLMDVTGLPS